VEYTSESVVASFKTSCQDISYSISTWYNEYENCMQKRYVYTKISIEFDLIQNVALDSGFGFIQVHISFFY